VSLQDLDEGLVERPVPALEEVLLHLPVSHSIDECMGGLPLDKILR
jgi:hypothetical protein